MHAGAVVPCKMWGEDLSQFLLHKLFDNSNTLPSQVAYHLYHFQLIVNGRNVKTPRQATARGARRASQEQADVLGGFRAFPECARQASLPPPFFFPVCVCERL